MTYNIGLTKCDRGPAGGRIFIPVVIVEDMKIQEQKIVASDNAVEVEIYVDPYIR